MNALTAQARPTIWLDDGRGIGERSPRSDGDGGAHFLRLLIESRLIRRQAELLGWLKQAREYLPHETLIAAWGDFQRGNVKCEIISHPVGPRAASALGCSPDDLLLRDAYTQWLRGGRQPLVGAMTLRSACECALHRALRGTQLVLIHGVRDKLSGCDSLYIALDSHRAPPPGDCSRFVALVHVLLCQVDNVWRHLAAFRLDNLPAAQAIAPPRVLELSAREREILESLSRGSTNHDIAEALAISLFTVKNHLKRIFRKIGVSNRTQAAARFNQELMRAELMPAQLVASAAVSSPIDQ